MIIKIIFTFLNTMMNLVLQTATSMGPVRHKVRPYAMSRFLMRDETAVCNYI